MSNPQKTPYYTRRILTLLGVDETANRMKSIEHCDTEKPSFDERAERGKVLFEKLYADAVTAVEHRSRIDEKLVNLRKHFAELTVNKPGYAHFVDTACTYARGFLEQGLDLFYTGNAMSVTLSTRFPSGRRVNVISYDCLYDCVNEHPPSNAYEMIAYRLKGNDTASVNNALIHNQDKKLVERIMS
jgi:hypothetical protein